MTSRPDVVHGHLVAHPWSLWTLCFLNNVLSFNGFKKLYLAWWRCSPQTAWPPKEAAGPGSQVKQLWAKPWWDPAAKGTPPLALQAWSLYLSYIREREFRSSSLLHLLLLCLDNQHSPVNGIELVQLLQCLQNKSLLRTVQIRKPEMKSTPYNKLFSLWINNKQKIDR